jgi:hypothetical protein
MAARLHTLGIQGERHVRIATLIRQRAEALLA